MDIENRPFDVVAGVQNGGDRYSLHTQKQATGAHHLFSIIHRIARTLSQSTLCSEPRLIAPG